MNWNTYKLLTKEEKEEYDFKFKDTPIFVFGPAYYFGLVCLMFLSAILLQNAGDLSLIPILSQALIRIIGIMIAVDLIWICLDSLYELRWVNKHIKKIHR